MWSQAVSFASYRASVMTAEQILIVRTGRLVELQLRSRFGNLGRTVLRRRD